MTSNIIDTIKNILLETTPFCNDIINIIVQYACITFKVSEYKFEYYITNIDDNGAFEGWAKHPFVILQRLNNNLIIQTIPRDSSKQRIYIRKIYTKKHIEYIRFNNGLVTANHVMKKINGKHIIE